MLRKMFKKGKKKQNPQNQPEQQENQENLSPSPFELLPTEIVLYLFSFLKPTDLVAASLVCSDFYKIAQDESLWKEFLAYTDQEIPKQKTGYKGLFFNWAQENGFFASFKRPSQLPYDFYATDSLFTVQYGDKQNVKVDGNICIVTLLEDKNGLANCFFEFYEDELPYILRLYAKPEADKFSIKASYLSAQEAKECNETFSPVIRAQAECVVPGAFYYQRMKELAKKEKSVIRADKESIFEWLKTFLLVRPATRHVYSIENSAYLSMECLFTNFMSRKSCFAPVEENKEVKEKKCRFGIR